MLTMPPVKVNDYLQPNSRRRSRTLNSFQGECPVKTCASQRSAGHPVLVVLIVLILISSAVTTAQAALSVSPIFGSNMVLQRNTTVPVFGTADAGATVSVQFQNQNVSTTAS